MSKLLQHLFFHTAQNKLSQPNGLLRQHKIPTILASGLLLISQPMLGEEVDITNITDTLHLTAEPSTADLSLSIDEVGQVNEMTVKFHSSPATLPNESQVTLSCGKSSNIVDKIFRKPGKYKIYYVTENDTITPTSQHSVVYKNKIDNQPPAAFNLFTPWDNAETKPIDLKLKWESATDPDDDAITYTLMIAENSDFNEIILQHKEISNSQFLIDYDTVFEDGGKGLEGDTTYYWRVTAVDSFGVQTTSRQFFSFQTGGGKGGFDQGDYNDSGVLGEPKLPSSLLVNTSKGRYLVTLTDNGDQHFTLEGSPQPTDKVDKHEANYDSQTGKLSIPGFGAMEAIEGISKWRLID